ncbi:MAG: LysM peptidoglycan-binding domain-containing protein [Roseivirga sp.]|nr:LysM peptidoglycan-binding domain-containing protein [Roseivirga sp.]
MSIVLKYTVIAGDTLSGIASRIASAAGISYPKIETANPDIPASGLQVGQVITIPATASGTGFRYTIRSGDSYSKIASELNKCHGLSLSDLETANPSMDPNYIRVGQVLNIPSTVSIAPLPPVVPATYMGYWLWTYSSGDPLPGANIGTAFSGWANVDTALADSAAKLGQLAGKKFLSIGGGNSNGAFSTTVLTGLNTAITAGKLSGYDGVAYDVEVGDSGLAAAFSTSFATARNAGLEVLVTISHSAPYGISDRSELMTTFFADTNINYLSPQLYTTGKEAANDYATTGGVTWDLYKGAKPAIVPSLVSASYYHDTGDIGKDALTFFQQQGVTIEGYIQWSQV